MLGVLFTSSFTTGTSGEPAALERKPPFRMRGLFFQTLNSAAHIAPTHPSKVNQILSQWLKPDLSFEVVCKLCRIKSSKSKTVLPVAIGNVVETLAVFNHGHLCKSLLLGLLPLS